MERKWRRDRKQNIREKSEAWGRRKGRETGKMVGRYDAEGEVDPSLTSMNSLL